MKKNLIFLLFLTFIFSLFSGYAMYNKKNNGKKTLPLVSKDISIKGSTFFFKDTFIKGKPVLQISYKELVEILGKPKKINYYKVIVPACEERENIAIAFYDGLEFTFELGFDTDRRKVEDSYGQAYDITGERYSFIGIKIGMSKKELLDKGYNIIRIPTKEEQMKLDSYPKESTFKLLHQLKPDSYYKDYKECVYINRDDANDNFEAFGLAIGAVVLFKNDKVDRIVFGYPTAD